MGKREKMNKQEIIQKYQLDSSHFWKHKQTGKDIISFEAIEIMIDFHNIKFDLPTQNFSNQDGEVSLLISGSMDDRTCWSFGEANSKNCYIDYKWAMAEKRGKARVCMKLLGFYGGNNGFYSDVEMEITGEIQNNADFDI